MNDDFEIEHYLAEKKQVVEHHLDRFLPPVTQPPALIHEAMRYSLFAGGKRIRPILALAVGEALSEVSEALIRLACALEMVHTYSLIHDDLPAMDNDDFRRGRPTCHREFGEGLAILAGNGLMARAFEILSEQAGEDGTLRLMVINRLCRAIGSDGGVIAGQVVDLATQGTPFTAEDLAYIHSSKTGALIEASVTCAAMLSGTDARVLEQLREFGLKAGLAFQIVDDILDVTGDFSEMGKTLGKDRDVQKATYPALFGLEASRREAGRLVDEAVAAIDFLGARGRALVELARFISVRRF